MSFHVSSSISPATKRLTIWPKTVLRVLRRLSKMLFVMKPMSLSELLGWGDPSLQHVGWDYSCCDFSVKLRETPSTLNGCVT